VNQVFRGHPESIGQYQSPLGGLEQSNEWLRYGVISA